MLLEDLKPGARVRGLAGAEPAEVVSASWFGDQAVDVVYRAGGRVDQRIVFRTDEPSLELADAGRAFSFDGDGETLRLASEALRIRLAYLFDPYLAVHASTIEALPHQITAVYGEMLPRQPLRFLLADDPGAGKTIMAGLLIKELIIRGDLERCLIVAPGSLVEQWQDELKEKFALDFRIVTRDQIEASLTGNPFVDNGRLILRLDMAARSDDLKAKLEAAPEWDLVICDEAHRMSASYFGNEVKETQRHRLGKLLGQRTRNLLLMTLSDRLKEAWPGGADHLALNTIRDWFTQYVRFERLRDETVLADALSDLIRDGFADYAYADGVGADGIYRGLAIGKTLTVRFDAEAVLVKKAVAEAQMRAATPAPSPDPGAPGGPAAPGPAQPGGVEQPAAPRALRRFYGSVDLDPTRPVKDLQPIIDSVISELLRADGVRLTLRLEIEATAPDGFKADDAAVVRDNARTLKFKPEATGFSEE